MVLPCALLISSDKRDNLNDFVNIGCSQWHKITTKIQRHKNKAYHIDTAHTSEYFNLRFERPTTALPLRINKDNEERYIKYRHILKCIGKAIHFLAKQNMPLRGHREEIVFGECDTNPGNFIALLKLLSENDNILREHLTAPVMRNVTSLRSQSQNEMIQVIGDHIIQEDILAEIRDSKFHSVVVDEVTSHNDQFMAICFRFVDKNKQIREEFVEFLEVDRITGEHLADKLLHFCSQTHLDLHQNRGQCYDGASNMSSIKKGLSGTILERNNKSVYTHCNSHILNLSIAGTVKVGTVESILEQMKAVDIFFNYSPKREGLLEHAVQNSEEISCAKKKLLISLCKTRWSERDKAFLHFYNSFPHVIEALEIIAGLHPNANKYDRSYTTWWDAQSKRDASSYIKGCCDFSFIVGLVSLKTLLHPLHGTTLRLQGKTIDIVKAYGENIEEQSFKEIYEDAVRLADVVSVEPTIPRTVIRQKHRNNTPSSCPEEYFRRTLAIPLLDTIIMEMETRFNDLSEKASKLLFLVPSILCDESIEFDDVTFNETIDFYPDDIPDSHLIFQELNLWKHRWNNIKADERPQNLAESLLAIDEITFPNLFVVLQIAATLPVTSCECERSFSIMRRLRTWLRASMTSERLSALALMNIHYGHQIDYDVVTDMFLKLHPGRLDCISLLV